MKTELTRDPSALFDMTLKFMRSMLTEDNILAWLKWNESAYIGHIHAFGYTKKSWLENYLTQVCTPFSIDMIDHGIDLTLSNLSIVLEMYNSEPLIDKEEHVCGWHYTGNPPEGVPQLADIAAWLPEAMEQMNGENQCDAVPVDGSDILKFIEEYKNASPAPAR